MASSDKARRRGIGPGLKLQAALALSESLQLIERSLLAEKTELESMAAWALRLTPTVCVELPDEMLLEVKSSLKLFGGLAAIEGRLMEEFRRRCIAARLSAAPTPLAALWLARNGGGDVERPEKVAGCLSALDLSISRWPDEIQSTLRAMGLRTMGDCLRLPREGFARRIGRQYLLELDKALGRAWDQREVFVPARRLSATVELLCEVTNTAALAKAGKQLADRLSRALLARQAQVQGLEMTFHHLHREPTKAQIDLVEPAHDAERIFRLLEGKLERIVLPAPAVCIGLRTAPMQPMRLRNEALPLRGAHARLDCAGNKELVERLRGRLGTEQVYGLALLAEHRPEAAWRKVTEGLFRTAFDGALMAPCASQRPLWLLPEPLPLKGGTGQPSYRGRLWLKSGPERIESGWWDGEDVARDYYLASAASGERFWVFQDRLDQCWYLHGVFG